MVNRSPPIQRILKTSRLFLYQTSSDYYLNDIMSDYSIDLQGKTNIVFTDEHYRYKIENGKDSVDLIIYVTSIDRDIQKAAPIIIKVPSDISYAIILDDCFMDHNELIDITALANLDVSKVISMRGLFYKCNHLTDISPISSWNVTNVKNMCCMFAGCLSLKNIHALSNWTVLENCDIRKFYTIPDVSLDKIYRYIFPEVNDIDAIIFDEELKSDSQTVWVEHVVPHRRKMYQNAYVKNNCPSWLVERYMKLHMLPERRMEYDYELHRSKHRNELGEWLFENYRDIIDYNIYNWL